METPFDPDLILWVCLDEKIFHWNELYFSSAIFLRNIFIKKLKIFMLKKKIIYFAVS